MTDKIEPALTAEEWAAYRKRGVTLSSAIDDFLDLLPEELARGIALANFSLPDDDPLKITREDVAILRGVLDILASYATVNAHPAIQLANGLAAKLEALLPPE